MPSRTSLDDATLVGRALSGDRWAEEALYRRHVRRVADVATRVLGRTTDAEDVVQETFLVVFKQLSSLREPDFFPRWLIRIAMNASRRRLRTRRVLRSFGLDRGADDATLEALAATTASPHTVAELREIDAVVRDLSANERVAWMLRHVEGFSLPETAEACDCSLATVKRRIRAAQDALERRIGSPDVTRLAHTSEDGS